MSYRNPVPYIPKTVGEIVDYIASMILGAPKFKDKTGYFPDQNINSEFHALNEGLKSIQGKIGNETYDRLIELSHKARVHFEADPEDKTEDGIMGRDCLMDIEEGLKAAARRKR